jgi:hypothetical protein
MTALLTTPEHVHVAVNHVPLIGLAFAGVPLLFAAVSRQRPVLWVGLFMVLISGAAMPVVTESGQHAADRFSDGKVAGGLDAAGEEWLAEHYERAETAAKLIYAVAAASIAGMAVLWKRPRATRVVAAVMLALCAVSVTALAWVADAGGRIRHPEFRPPDHDVTLEKQEATE